MVKVVQWRDLFDQQHHSGHQPDHAAASSRTPSLQPATGAVRVAWPPFSTGVWWPGPGLSPGETGDSVGDFLELGVGLLSS